MIAVAIDPIALVLEVVWLATVVVHPEVGVATLDPRMTTMIPEVGNAATNAPALTVVAAAVKDGAIARDPMIPIPLTPRMILERPTMTTHLWDRRLRKSQSRRRPKS